MKTREELLNHFKVKYTDNNFILDVLESKTTEELQKIYETEIKREVMENEILDNGTVTYTIDFDHKLRKDVEKYMWDNNMFTMYDGKISYRCSNDGRLLGVPIKFIEELQKKFNLKLSRKMYILGKKDIQNFKVGDKISITTSGIFGNSMNQGTVYEVDEDTITVRKYRSRTKGYTLSVGDECNIEKIDKFQKVS